MLKSSLLTAYIGIRMFRFIFKTFGVVLLSVAELVVTAAPNVLRFLTICFYIAIGPPIT